MASQLVYRAKRQSNRYPTNSGAKWSKRNWKLVCISSYLDLILATAWHWVVCDEERPMHSKGTSVWNVASFINVHANFTAIRKRRIFTPICKKNWSKIARDSSTHHHRKGKFHIQNHLNCKYNIHTLRKREKKLILNRSMCHFVSYAKTKHKKYAYCLSYTAVWILYINKHATLKLNGAFRSVFTLIDIHLKTASSAAHYVSIAMLCLYWNVK